jgi:hypothetical protein
LKLLRCFIIGSLCLLTHGVLQQAMAALAPLQQQIKIPPQISNVTLNPSSVTGGVTPVVGTVTLNQTAPPGGVLVTFNNSNPSVAAVPPSVVVQPGASSATFVIQTYPVAQNPNVVTNPPSADISAQVGNFAPRITRLTVLPATLTSLTLSPTSILSGATATGQVTISGPAPAGGLVVGLSSSAAATSSPPRLAPSTIRQTAPATVPQQVMILPGTTTAVFSIITGPVPNPTPVNITASYGAFNAKTASLTVLPLGLESLSLPNTNIQGGTTSTGTVALSGAAPAGGADVKLTVSRLPNTFTPECSPMPSAPAQIQVKSGEKSATFSLSTFPVGINPNWFSVTAAYGSSSVYTAFHVSQAQVASLALPASVKGGTTVQLVITLNGPMGQCPGNYSSILGRITITNSNPIVAQTPSYVQVPSGGTSATVAITTSAVAQATAVTIEAYHTWEQYKNVATLTLTP